MAAWAKPLVPFSGCHLAKPPRGTARVIAAPVEGTPRKRGARTASSPDVLVAVDPAVPTPNWRQVYNGLRNAILGGRLRTGARLPATRTLAAELSLSRNTITAAYDQLRAEGYIEQRVGAGSFVAHTVPDTLLASVPATRHRQVTRAGAPASAPAALSARGVVLASARLGAYAPGAGRLIDRATCPYGQPIAFRSGVPALDAFPTSVWSRIVARRWRRGEVPLTYGDPAGYRPLREAIAEYVASARGVRCEYQQVLIVNGSQQGLDLASRLLLDPGDQVWMEDPGYSGARAAFEAAGAVVIPVPVDAGGMQVAEGACRAPRARLAYVTPSHQCPLGPVMSAARRLALLQWAEAANAWIVEDDYDSEFRYAGRPLPSLQGLDEQNRVIYVGTFSKTLFPALRIAYMVVPPNLSEPFSVAHDVASRHAPAHMQTVLTDFIVEGHFARHVRRMRALYAERQRVLLAAAGQALSEHLEIAPADAGLHLVGWLPSGVRDVDASRAAWEHGVQVSPLSRHAITPPARGALLLGYAAYTPAQLRTAAERLARALSSHRSARRHVAVRTKDRSAH